MSTRRQRHVPLRTCVICREKSAKRELVRIARTPSGSVEVDLSGKAAGRGAYLCRRESCWRKAIRTGRLEYVLRGKISEASLSLIREFAQTLTAVES